MKKLNQQGASTTLLIAIVALTVMLIGALSFGIWAYGSQQDYKNNTDKKIAAAVKVASYKLSSVKDNEFAQREKSPTKTYKGPDTYGGVTIKYPKTWSAYVSQAGDSSNPLDGYFHPGFVPDTESGTAYALRIQVTAEQYSQELSQFDSLVSEGKVKVVPYRAAKVKGTLGVRLTGEVTQGKQGSMVMFPLRDKTLKIWTESSQFVDDFNKFILPNLSFSP